MRGFGTSSLEQQNEVFRLANPPRGSVILRLDSWLPHGRAFVVKDQERLVKEILPKYFQGQTRWGSFSRQLQLYGFQRVVSGPDHGAHYSEMFLEGRPDLCRYMRRIGAPRGLDRRTFKLPNGGDPNFYAMGAVSPRKTA